MKAQDQKELMRERICDCAKRLFEREGYEQVSMRQIAAEAGIAVGNMRIEHFWNCCFDF